MKFIKIYSFLLLLSSVKVSAQNIISADLQVTGLTCSMCSQATEKSLKTLDFISEVKPDLNKNIFMLSFKPGRPINVDLLRKKVEDAGFSVGGLTASFKFDDLKVDAAGRALDNGKIYQFVNVKGKVLDGTVRATVVDKNFLPASEFKKKAGQINSPAYATGSTVVNGKKTRVFHLSI